jgi:hypothetical protein
MDRETEMAFAATWAAELEAMRRNLDAAREENIRLRAEVAFRGDEINRLRRELDAVRAKDRRAR